MKKKIFILFTGIMISVNILIAQDQTINGNLTVTEKLTSKGIKLNYTSYPGWMKSYIEYPGNSLIIGNPENSSHECNIDILPGGIDGKTLRSWLTMFVATGKGVQSKKVLIHTQGNSFFNGGNVGIGTEAPTEKLEVDGTIKTTNLDVVNNITMGSTDENTISKIVIKGPNLPSSVGNQRDISFEFRSAGKSVIRAFRGNGYGNNLQLMTSDDSGPTPKVRMHINYNGNIGIGGITNPKSTLDVNGTIRSKEVKIEATGWADFVFGKDYQLPSLSEVATHIEEKGTLPDIPSEKEVIENGINVAEMQAKLLQKIEELTLYVIEQEKKIEKLQKQLDQK